MTKTVTYTVLRQHEGDRFYNEGDTRELEEGEAKHLVTLGVLVDASDANAKSEGAPLNKAEGTPLNKAQKASTNKSRKG